MKAAVFFVLVGLFLFFAFEPPHSMQSIEKAFAGAAQAADAWLTAKEAKLQAQ